MVCLIVSMRVAATVLLLAEGMVMFASFPSRAYSRASQKRLVWRSVLPGENSPSSRHPPIEAHASCSAVAGEQEIPDHSCAPVSGIGD